MNKLTAAFSLLLILFAGQATAHAQSDLDQLADKLQDIIKSEKRDWKCHAEEEPKLGATAERTVHCWSSSRGVRISILSYNSAVDAQTAQRESVQKIVRIDSVNTHQLSGIGDEAWTIGSWGENIDLRKGKFPVG